MWRHDCFRRDMPLIDETGAERIARLTELLADLKRLRDEHVPSGDGSLPETEAAIARIETELARSRRHQRAAAAKATS